jgi:hypothetical protein
VEFNQPPLQPTDGGHGFGQEQPSRLRERHCSPLATVQETSTERLLQPLDLQADGGTATKQRSVHEDCELQPHGFDVS